MTNDDQTFEGLGETQLLRLFTSLQVPMVVQSLLDGTDLFDEEARVALHDLISSQTPDQALLSVALSCMVIETRLRTQNIRIAEILSMSAEMMVQDYAPLYLEQMNHGHNSSLFDRDDLEFLSTIPEDLETLSDLLSVVADVMPAHLSDYRVLVEILSIQASAQALIAETVVEAMGVEPDITLYEESRMVVSTEHPLPDNVVPFKRR